MPRAILKPKHAKPLFGRHPWVYRGSIARVDGECADGQIVRVESAEGKFLGKGYLNPKSQIAVRILTWDEAEEVDEGFWRRRLTAALELRDKTLNLAATTNACRLVNSSGVRKALRGYKDININALRLLGPGGILFTCSCSQHITDELFERMLSDAAAEAGRPVQILERRGQAKDHPTLAACPETRYLKCYVCAISDFRGRNEELRVV